MEKELDEVWRCAVCAEGACPDAAASLSYGVPPAKGASPAPRRRLRRFGTRSATAPSLIFLDSRRSVFVTASAVLAAAVSGGFMEKELDEVFVVAAC